MLNNEKNQQSQGYHNYMILFIHIFLRKIQFMQEKVEKGLPGSMDEGWTKRVSGLQGFFGSDKNTLKLGWERQLKRLTHMLCTQEAWAPSLGCFFPKHSQEQALCPNIPECDPKPNQNKQKSSKRGNDDGACIHEYTNHWSFYRHTIIVLQETWYNNVNIYGSKLLHPPHAKVSKTLHH